MYIRQISIFLANKSGTLAEVTDFLYQHNVNLRSQVVGGDILQKIKGFLTFYPELAHVADIEYAYAFTTAQAGTAIILLRVENNAAAECVLKDTPFQTVGPEVLNV